MESMEATTVVVVPCHSCLIGWEILNVSVQGLADWRGGKLIQNALPELNADQRELLISGTCPTCWNEMFPPE
tara:strand:- start:516 stop:731 length:216 start_codon:yes stop_codon:yes gene_type:complete